MIPQLAQLPTPTRLPHRPNFEPAATPALLADLPQDTELTLTLARPDVFLAAAPSAEHTTDSGAPPSPPGIAVFTADTEARLHWLPLSTVAADQPARWQVRVPQRSPLLVTIAPREQAALRGYWLQLPVAPLQEPVELSLPTELHPVELAIQFDGGPVAAPTFTLRRASDPSWHQRLDWQPSEGAASGVLRCWLGRDEYEVAPMALQAEKPKPFAVRGPERVSIRFARPAAAGDRR